MILGSIARKSFGGIVAVVLTTGVCAFGQTRSAPVDPGVRGGPAGAGTSLKGLTADETLACNTPEYHNDYPRSPRNAPARALPSSADPRSAIRRSSPSKNLMHVNMRRSLRGRICQARCQSLRQPQWIVAVTRIALHIKCEEPHKFRCGR